MPKNKKKKQKNKQTENEVTGEHYCEYVCSNGDWYLVGANIEAPPQYCPYYPFSSDNVFHEGYLVRIDPEEYQSVEDQSDGDQSDGDRLEVGESGDTSILPEPAPSFYYCKYDYSKEHKCFILSRANCPQGYYAPRTLSLKHVKKHGFVCFPVPIPIDSQ
ncbi:MAG: hypothetical protein MI861_02895 [Pirellulales bacterium]|nr:hypothetical protein [Pirellulales bacterium]